MGEPTRRLLVHLIFSTISLLHRPDRRREGLHVPVSSKYVERTMRGASWRALRAAGLVDSHLPYSKAEGRSYAFRVAEDVLREFLDRRPTLERVAADGLRDPWTGHRPRHAVTSDRYDDGRNPLPPLPVGAMDAVSEAG